MQISFNTVQNNNNHYYGTSFKAMCKTDFMFFDRKVIEKVKAPIKDFNVYRDFDKYCKGLVDNIMKTDFGGSNTKIAIQRKNILDSWFKYIKRKPTYDLRIPEKLMILLGITENLKPNNNSMPPFLNKAVLRDTRTAMDRHSADKGPFNFDKDYRSRLQRIIFNEENLEDINSTGWIVIPSIDHDPKNHKKNVEKLKKFSHKNWKLESLYKFDPQDEYHSPLYIKDFHIYMDNGKPILAIDVIDNGLFGISGCLNGKKIPVKYYDVVKNYLKYNNLTHDELGPIARSTMSNLEKMKAEVDSVKAKLSKCTKDSSSQEVLEALGIQCKKDTDGMLIISHYGDLKKTYSYTDLGIDENKLFKDIKEISGNAFLEFSEVSDLGNLQKIGGNVRVNSSPITDLGELKFIGGDANFNNSKITSLGNLQKIGGNVKINSSSITDLGELKFIGGDANFNNSKITSLGNLQKIGGNAIFSKSKVNNLGKLEEISGNARFDSSQITDLGELKFIGGDADFNNSEITSLGKLKKIGGNVQFNCFPVRELYKLEEIGGNITIKPDSLGMSKLLKAVFEINDDRICNRIVLLDKPVNLNKSSKK